MTVVTALIILCICNVVALAVITLRLISIFSSGRAELSAAAPIPPSPHTTPYPTAPMTEEELREARRKFDSEMAAFQEIMNYNVDVAYGTSYGEEV